ncbi:glycine oxidase ThiO [Gammaproteobacteria bacterium AS21]|jgi:glycine oxidase
MHSSNIAVVGAGLVGRLLSYQLSQRSLNVTLYEANDLSSTISHQHLSAAAFTAAGMIAPISEAIEADIDTFHLGQSSLQMWPKIIAQLTAVSGEHIAYRHNGSLIISHPQDTAELTHFKRQVDLLATKCNASYQPLNSHDIQALEPDISPVFTSGLLLNDEADVDNRQLMDVLLKQAVKQGVTLKDNSKVCIANDCVINQSQRIQYDWVIDCRGLGAKEHLTNLRGVRGEVLRVSCPEVTLSRPVRLMHPRYQLYLVPKPNHQYVIGATQIESEDRSPVSIQSMLELGSAMYSINPAFCEARIIEQNTNLRPAFADNNAQILVHDKHISINGLFRHGYLIAPAISHSVMQWLDGKKCPHFNILFKQPEPSHA